MDPVLDAKDVTVGFHPDGYRIDKTASAMNWYTKWEISDGKWSNAQPVCFDSMPGTGWVKTDKIDWKKNE